MMQHPYIRYAQALLMNENQLSSTEEITVEHIKSEIENGLNTFRMQPMESIDSKDKVKYCFLKMQKGDPKKGIFLSPNSMTSDMQAKNLWNAANSYLTTVNKDNINILTSIGMSEVPVTGEFLSFSENNSIGRGRPKATIMEQGLGLITTLTSKKPCLQYKIVKKGQPDINVCFIPDLSLKKMIDFIYIFKKMMLQQLDNNLMIGHVIPDTNKKGEIVSYIPKRPLIFNGNFPNPPKSSALGSIALIGAIGEFTKQTDISDKAKSVLESLKDTTMYMITLGGANTFSYNHYIIDLAKNARLNTVVDSLYYSKLYNQARRTNSNSEYQKFDLFTSRFLQLFTAPAFKDFLSFRAEYPEPVKTLFNIYFIKMERISPNIVTSARQLGKWLNLVAYFAAKEEIKEGSQYYWEEIRKVKSKVLVELESSTFSAKTGNALIAQVVTRAGRLSNSDVPEGASLFMEKTATGELALDDAKNLLIAFSRLRNKKQSEEQPHDIAEEYGDNSEDLSNI